MLSYDFTYRDYPHLFGGRLLLLLYIIQYRRLLTVWSLSTYRLLVL